MTFTPAARAISLAATIVLLVVLAACGPGSATGSASSPSAVASASTASVEPSATTEPSAEGFACNLPIDGVGSTNRAQITDVAVSEQDGYDRITFTFASGVPQFRIEVGTPPFSQDASGLPIDVDGEAFWVIRLNGGTKVTPDGGITYNGPTDFTPGFPKLVQLVEGGDFEAVSTWFVGMTAESCIRVATGNGQLVIDIQH